MTSFPAIFDLSYSHYLCTLSLNFFYELASNVKHNELVDLINNYCNYNGWCCEVLGTLPIK